MLVTNETLAPLYLDTVRSALEQSGVNVDSVILPDGEQYKSLAVMDTVFTALLQKPHGRDTTLVALGGGVIGDLTGFRRGKLSARRAFHPGPYHPVVAGRLVGRRQNRSEPPSRQKHDWRLLAAGFRGS